MQQYGGKIEWREKGKHSYVVTVTVPTCTEEGHIFYTCEHYGHSYVSDPIEALGHKMGDWIVLKEAECGQAGMQHRQCERCELSEQEEIPALTHSFTNMQITAPGEEKAFCECGEYEVSYITGWILYNGVYYYRLNDENHTLVMEDTIIDNAISEFDANGVWLGYAAAGGNKIGSATYYFTASGAMVTGTRVIDGISYQFNGSGALVGTREGFI